MPPIVGANARTDPAAAVGEAALWSGGLFVVTALWCLTAQGLYPGVGWFLVYALLVGLLPPVLAASTLLRIRKSARDRGAGLWKAALIACGASLAVGPALILRLSFPVDPLPGPYLWVAAPQVALLFLALVARNASDARRPWTAIIVGLPLAIPAAYWSLMAALPWDPGDRESQLERYIAGFVGTCPPLCGHFYLLIFELMAFASSDLVIWGSRRLRH